MVEDSDFLMIDDDFDNFPYDFKNYIKSTKLTWRRLDPMNSWVFSSEDAVKSESPPTHSSGGVPNSVPKTLIDNGKVTDKTRSVIEKLVIDFDRFKSGVLIQLWVPRTDGDRCVLTTADQPFGLCEIEALCKFRMKSTEYKFYVDEESADDPGVLGHVFRKNELAFTPDVMHYSNEEYPQRNDAIKSSVQTSMAFPVIEHSTQCCVGVLELLFTKVFLNALYIVIKVNAEFQDAGLEKSDTYGHLVTPVDYKAHNQVLGEISKGMKVVCETHKLLLSLAWVPCRCGRDVELGGSCSKCYVSCKGQVMNTIVSMQTFYAFDVYNQGFVNSCSDYYIRTGHGVVGSALQSYSPCFCKDVTRFSKTEYPLVHLARMYRLTSSFAICLRSAYTGDADYVIEFFLPQNIEGDRVPRTLLYSILATMKQHFHSFKVASGEELGQELSIEVLKDRSPGKSFQICQIIMSTQTQVWQNVGETVQLDSTNQQLMVEADAINNERNVVGPARSNGRDVIYSKNNGSARASMEQETQTGNLITRDFLEQLFKRPLQDAADTLKVSRSTFKRICRKQGIRRWPRGKKTERNGSLAELNQENEYVQGAEETACLTVPFSLEPSALAVSAQPDEPREEMVIENEWTLHDLRNLCPTGIDSDAIISTRSEASVGGAFTEIIGTLHDFDNLCPAVPDCQPDSEQKFQQTIGSLPANSLSDGHFPTVQLEFPLGGTPIEMIVVSSRDVESRCPLVGDACQENELELHLAAMSTAPSLVNDATISTRPEDSIKGAFTDSAGSSHGFRNLCPAVQDHQHDSEQEFQQAIGSLPANSLSDGHFPTVQPEMQVGRSTVKMILPSSRDIGSRQEKELELHLAATSTVPELDACVEETIHDSARVLEFMQKNMTVRGAKPRLFVRNTTVKAAGPRISDPRAMKHGYFK